MIDLDELVLLCKDKEAQKYISEAVACYKTGAFRACIVTTWIAVVYDFVYKLRQLELTGDKNAISKLEEFEKARSSKTPELALRFEKKILEWARDEFEFLSPIQYDDLERLLTDRNRCAHPSMISAEEIYQPPAELARYHLHNAITHLLQHPPVQGKAALNRLQSDILSQYFPTDTAKAKEFFSHGPLANAKIALVRNFVIVILKMLLSDDLDSQDWRRFTAALNATRQMYRPTTEQTFQNQLSKIIQDLRDSHLHQVVRFLGAVTDTWQFLSGDIHTRIENYVSNVDDIHAAIVLSLALDISELQPHAERRLVNVDADLLRNLVEMKPRSELISRGIAVYKTVGSYDLANIAANNIIIPLIPFMDAKQAKQIIKYASQNDQISYSYNFIDVLSEIMIEEVISEFELKSLLEEYRFREDLYFEVFPDEKPSSFNMGDIPF